MDQKPFRKSTSIKVRDAILETPRSLKRAILGVADFVLIALALWIVISLRYGFLYWPENILQFALFILAPTISVITFAWMKLYRLVTRYLGVQGFSQIFLSMILAVLIWSTFLFLFGQGGIPRSIIFPYAALATLFVVFIRFLAGLILRSAGIRIPRWNSRVPPRATLIYGAGDMGVRILQEIRRSGDRYVVAIIDKSKSMHGQVIMGTKVSSPEQIKKLISRYDIKEIILAIPYVKNQERRAVIRELEKFQLEVLVLPDYEDVATGRINLKDLREIDVVDLLNRDSVEPKPELLSRSIMGKSILITGAGGSIGSELVRQVLRQSPSRLVLLDISEFALYQIEIEVLETMSKWVENKRRPEVYGILGSVLDTNLINEVIRNHSIKTIYHAAAYKHVPIVESNIIAGIENNSFGMKVIADAATHHAVELVLLISTDKAVRPTNVMGASKRLAELILQSLHSDKTLTKFAIVRFGNVLDSSGSVVARFRKQISSGGPVTVTHREITRYFMSIPEAAALVIQAGAMANGGDVFLLDMGDPIRIDDLARQMIRLSGLEVRDENNPDGDIEIIYTGLRPGEKLYEELLITPSAVGTEHPRILKSQEPFIEKKELEKELELLKTALNLRDKRAIQKSLIHLVEDYLPEPLLQDEIKKEIAVDGSTMIH